MKTVLIVIVCFVALAVAANRNLDALRALADIKQRHEAGEISEEKKVELGAISFVEHTSRNSLVHLAVFGAFITLVAAGQNSSPWKWTRYVFGGMSFIAFLGITWIYVSAAEMLEHIAGLQRAHLFGDIVMINLSSIVAGVFFAGITFEMVRPLFLKEE